MSVLLPPRVYFKGMMSWNPATSNNNPKVYDGTSAKVILPAGETYKTFKKWMMGIKQGKIRSGWDYFGDHATNFVSKNTRITGGVTSKGDPADAADPLVGRPVQILGNTFNAQNVLPACRLVDVDPASAWSSQIYFDNLAIGEGDGSITGPRRFRMYSRWLNFGRNYNADGKLIIAGIASVVWQTCIPFKKLAVANGARSRLLADLARAMQGPKARGLMIRFCTYRTLYYQNGVLNDLAHQPRNAEQLSRLYRKGEIFANPAYSLVVGAIGVWKEGELATVPSGRYLVPRTRLQPKDRNLDPQPLGPAVVEIDSRRKRASLDLNSAIPEVDSTGKKANYGTLTLVLDEGMGAMTTLGSLGYSDYNKTAYERSAGIVDVALDTVPTAAKLKKGTLALLARQAGRWVVALGEESMTAQTDDRGVYIDQASSQKITIRVTDRAGPPPQGTTLVLAHYDSQLMLIADPKALSLLPPTAVRVHPDDVKDDRRVEIAGGNVVKVRANGTATVTFKSLQPGFSNVAFFPVPPGGMPPPIPGQMNPMTAFYTSIRVLPFDDQLAKTADKDLTWKFVYDNLLRVYDLIFPIMSEVVPLSRRRRVEAAVQQIRALTASGFHESTLYMPITRDLSAGKRELIQRWCNLVERGDAP